MEMIYEIRQKEPEKSSEVFAEELLKGLLEMGGAAVAPHLTCTFNVLKDEYEIGLSFPTRLFETDTGIADVK